MAARKSEIDSFCLLGCAFYTGDYRLQTLLHDTQTLPYISVSLAPSHSQLKYRVRPLIPLHLYRLDLIKQPSFSFCS